MTALVDCAHIIGFIITVSESLEWEQVEVILKSNSKNALEEELRKVGNRIQLLLRPKGAPNGWTILHAALGMGGGALDTQKDSTSGNKRRRVKTLANLPYQSCRYGGRKVGLVEVKQKCGKATTGRTRFEDTF